MGNGRDDGCCGDGGDGFGEVPRGEPCGVGARGDGGDFREIRPGTVAAAEVAERRASAERAGTIVPEPIAKDVLELLANRPMVPAEVPAGVKLGDPVVATEEVPSAPRYVKTIEGGMATAIEVKRDGRIRNPLAVSDRPGGVGGGPEVEDREIGTVRMDAPVTGVSDVIEGVGLPASLVESIDEQLGEALAELIPIDPGVVLSGADPRTGYNGAVHIALCRLRVLGFSNNEAARACGLTPRMLGEWLNLYPKLQADMFRAAELGKSRAASKLFELMGGDGMVAFNAVKFFLSTHSPEFKETQEVRVTSDPKDVIAQIREQIYGITEDDSFNAGEIIDAEVEEGNKDVPALPPGSKDDSDDDSEGKGRPDSPGVV